MFLVYFYTFCDCHIFQPIPNFRDSKIPTGDAIGTLVFNVRFGAVYVLIFTYVFGLVYYWRKTVLLFYFFWRTSWKKKVISLTKIKLKQIWEKK